MCEIRNGSVIIRRRKGPQVGPWQHVGVTMESHQTRVDLLSDRLGTESPQVQLDQKCCWGSRLSPLPWKIPQVRRDDQSRYHNLKPPSSLGSGWNEIHCPPAGRKEKEKRRGFTSIQMLHTHTHQTKLDLLSDPSGTESPHVQLDYSSIDLRQISSM